MNKVFLMGRLTKDPDIRDLSTKTARFQLGIDRRFTKDKQSDFPTIVAFNKQAEFAEKYLRKGIKILVTGHIQTGSYTNREGQKVYTTDVIAEEMEFVESKGASAPAADDTVPVYTDKEVEAPKSNVTQMPEWMKVAEGTDDELPFS